MGPPGPQGPVGPVGAQGPEGPEGPAGAPFALPYQETLASADPLLQLANSGTGHGLDVLSAGPGQAIRAVTTGANWNATTAAIYGEASGLNGTAGFFYASDPAGNNNALYARTDGLGTAMFAQSFGQGTSLIASSLADGAAIRAVVTGSGTASALVVESYNSANVNPAFIVRSEGIGALATFVYDPVGPVARIDNAGVGYFNGGTLVGGADVAEFVPTHGDVPQPSDVVEIDPDRPKHFRLSREANSTRVAGVISTKPGVTLNADSGATADVSGPALALVGRVPVKVTDENGPIRAGDLLVTSSTPGHAMRAPDSPKPGTVIGKSMERHTKGSGTVEVLVMLR